MEIGLSLFNGVSVENSIKAMKKHGVKHTFVMADIPDFEEAVKRFTENGITLDNLHAPYKGINAMWGDDEEAAEEMLAKLMDSVDKCAKHGIPATIVHLSSGRPMPAITEEGLKRYERLFAYGKEKGVVIVLENLRYAENLAYFMEHYPECAYCWDNGHEYCSTKGARFMHLYQHRLAALHLHDNRCGDDTDDHLLPFDGSIPMDQVAQDIADSGYQGTLMLEVGRHITLHTYDDMTEEEFMERAIASAERLNELVESCRN